MSGLRLELIVRTYPEGDRWTWRLFSGRNIVSSSDSQLFSRRVDCARGAEVGGGLSEVREALDGFRGAGPVPHSALRHDENGWGSVPIAVLDERGAGGTP
jgi:hypothetical protein